MSRAGRRYVLRIVLAVTALAALIWVAADQFAIPPEQIQTLFVSTLLAVGLVIVPPGWRAGRVLTRLDVDLEGELVGDLVQLIRKVVQ